MGGGSLEEGGEFFFSCVPPLVKVCSFPSELQTLFLQDLKPVPFFAINSSEVIPQC